MKKVMFSLVFMFVALFSVANVYAVDCIPSTSAACAAGCTSPIGKSCSSEGATCSCPNMFGGDDVKSVGTATGLSNTSLPMIIGNVVKLVLGLFGIVATVIVVYGGVKWMTSQGDTSKIDAAKKVMIAGGVGMLLIVSGYAVTSFLINGLMKTVGAS